MVAPKPTQSSKQETGLGCLTRLSWMLLGNVGILISSVSIAKHNGSFLSYADLAYWLIIAFVIGIRYIDITRMQGLTATGEPATINNWRRYVLYMGIFACVLWGIVHAIARFQ
jgi:hypothetical protein